MSSDEIDTYLAGVPEPGRSTLRRLRTVVCDILPEAEEGLSYGVPAFRLGGTAVAGFAAFAGHLSYLPHSGRVLTELGDAVAGYGTSKGALRFPLDEPLPRGLVEQLIAARRREAGV